MKYVSIISAKYLKDYIIEFKFSDKKTTQVDFYPFIRRSGGPSYSKFLDIYEFKKFTFDGSGIYWGNAMDFPMSTLLKGGKITPTNTMKMLKYQKDRNHFSESAYRDIIKHFHGKNKLILQARKFFGVNDALLDLKHSYTEIPKEMDIK